MSERLYLPQPLNEDEHVAPFAEQHPYRTPLDVAAGFTVGRWFGRADEEGHLFVGAAPRHLADYEHLVRETGTTHVLNVADDVEASTIRFAHPLGLSWLQLPFRDDGSVPPDGWFEQGVRYAFEAITAGGVVYVHCLVGSARGPAMAYAVLRRQGVPARRAGKAVRLARPTGSHYYLPDAERWARARWG